MPNPTGSDLHVDQALTNVSIAYLQNAQGFVADRMFSNIPVTKRSNIYYKYDRADFWRSGYEKRGDVAESVGGGWKVTTDNFYIDVWALHKDIGDQLRSNADDVFDLNRDATIWLSEQAMISREVAWAANYFTTSVWTGTADNEGNPSPSTDQFLYWNNDASTPITDIKEAMTGVQLKTGYRPNVMALGRQVWDKLSEHPDVIDRIKYSSGNDNPAVATLSAFAKLCELEEVMVMDGIRATNNENPSFETSLATSFIAGKNALLVYRNPTPSIMMPSAGYTFSWANYLGAAGQFGEVISNYRMDLKKADRIEGEMAYMQKVVCPDCGSFFHNAVQ